MATMTNIQEEELLSPQQTQRVIAQLSEHVQNDFIHSKRRVLVGIQRGGAIIARMIQQNLTATLGFTPPLGFLDITFYRDDLATVGPNPVVATTELHMNIDDREITLVDDILYSGRTIRCALDALFDYGRPARVDLVVLVDRGHRQLPICPKVTGMTVETAANESIKLKGQLNDGTLHVVRRFIVTPFK